jgi:hypothetical protein
MCAEGARVARCAHKSKIRKGNGDS